MTTTQQAERRTRIEAAAYDLLQERGFAGTSMLAIAKRARASNETLYNWYGDKTGLFRSLVIRNAEESKELLEGALTSGADPMATLDRLAPVLLRLLVGKRAVALNRAAAADASGVLGQALSESGRESVAPLIEAVLERAHATGRVTLGPDLAHAIYMGLLVGDWQLRRVTMQATEADEAEIAARATWAVAQFRRLAT